MDADSVGAHKGLGKIFLAKKEFANAVRELKPTESLAPSQWQTHDLLGDALTGTGDFDGAIAEYKEALQIWPKNAAVMLKLAASLEKKEDLIGALEQYRLAAETQRDDKARAQYAAAQKRINAHIQSLKVSGHSGEAAELESRLTATYAASNNPEAEWQASVDAGIDALGKGHYEDSQAFLRTAVSLAEKLQPRDYRLTRTIGQLGHMYQNQQKFPEAAGEFRRQLAVTEEIYGAQSPENATPLMLLGTNALLQHDYISAERYYSRGLELNEKTFGPTSWRVETDLLQLAEAYVHHRSFEKAEQCLQRALAINETLYGPDNYNLEHNTRRLGDLYSQWGKFDKSEPYYRRMLALEEKQYGPDSQMITPTLQLLADVLTNLGRVDEAQQLRKRSQALVMARGQKH